ncbi:helix-turn-helix transcriptional regulator [Planomonospora sp. ID82291]|uniref:helix-turn-helix domain-containing protein n=1 Tax=Planomonospora sp. ID82291 TaxID=2738136 RepID=UPI0018C3D93C|nr:helix-turn-helix transcriptional regulator [Planomonospora sp. ID82291]
MDVVDTRADAPGALTPWAEFGRQLRRWRQRAGLTQAQVGTRVGYDHSAISKLEGGRREPSPQLARRLDEVLGAGGELLAVYTASRHEETEGAPGAIGRSGLGPPPGAAGSRFGPLPGDGGDGAGSGDGRDAGAAGLVFPDVFGWPCRLPGRGFECPLHDDAGCTVPAPVDALPAYLAFCASDLPADTGSDTVHVLSGLLVACWRAGTERTSPETITVVEQALHAIARRVEGLAGPARRVLWRLATGYAQLAGELRMQRGQNGMAMAWLHKGLGWAAASDDIGACATILYDMSTVARLENDAPSALAYARAIRTADPGLRWTAVAADLCEARAHALGGDALESRRHLVRARTGLSRLGERDLTEAPWLCGASGEVHLESGTGGALRDIAALTADRSVACLAAEAMERSLGGLAERMRPARLLLTLRLADCHACAGDPEAALAVAAPVLAEAVSVPSALIGRELRGLRGRLAARWSGRPDVRDFTDRFGRDLP